MLFVHLAEISHCLEDLICHDTGPPFELLGKTKCYFYLYLRYILVLGHDTK